MYNLFAIKVRSDIVFVCISDADNFLFTTNYCPCSIYSTVIVHYNGPATVTPMIGL